MPESCDALPEDTPPSKPVRRRPNRSRTLDDTDAGKRTSSLDIISSFDMGMVDLSFNTTASTSITSARGDSKMGGSSIAAAMRVATLEATMEEEEENKMKERENVEEIELSNYDILVDCLEDDNDALNSAPSGRKKEEKEDNDDVNDNDEQLKDTEKTTDNDEEKEKSKKGEGETAEGNDEAEKKDETMEQQKKDIDDNYLEGQNRKFLSNHLILTIWISYLI